MWAWIIGISAVLIVLFTSPIWVPILLFTTPFILLWAGIIYGILRLLGLWGTVAKQGTRFYDWLFFKSDKPRKFLWQQFYNFLCWMFPQEEWKTMNYGYAINTETGFTIYLDPEEESERFSYQLYHYMATGFKKIPNLNGLKVLEVGCGRGGGLAYVLKYLKPASAVGVDYSKQQVEFCKKTHTGHNINFVWGDAEHIPAEDQSIDVVLNVESSHCYGNIKAFITEVNRILRPGGHFFITDFLYENDLAAYEEALGSTEMKLQEKQDITDNVLLSLNFDSKRRSRMILNRTPRLLHPILKRFSGVEGSNIYTQMKSRESVYVAYHLVKPKKSEE
ncbi:unnamed protein product [Blepharisma stoltei]|uniref:Methyltransferase type 11 domain-containing protein n=1 Tax=Blepharisma stoltei TaxID=1481888 RepID=A0AAU9JR60_9CILI|nr:unnamed protein product [Blepharisma stoltei]